MKKRKLTDADILLGISKLNQQKLRILLEMRNLEFCGKNMDDEFFELLADYKMIYDAQRQKLSKLDSEKVQDLITEIYDINSRISKYDSFEEILSDADQYLIIKRILFDLGEQPLSLYCSNNDNNNLILNTLGMMFGSVAIMRAAAPKENNINEDAVNECMSYDFFNTLLSVIQRKIEDTTSNEERKDLLDLKYRLIFLIPVLEKRALLEQFLVDCEIALTDNSTIKITGISVEEYIEELDNALVSYGRPLIIESVFEYSLSVLQEMLISTVVILLDSNELYEQLLNDIESYSRDSDSDVITDIMKKVRGSKTDNKELRKRLF